MPNTGASIITPKKLQPPELSKSTQLIIIAISENTIPKTAGEKILNQSLLATFFFIEKLLFVKVNNG